VQHKLRACVGGDQHTGVYGVGGVARSRN